MTERDAAVRIVEEELEYDYQRELRAGLEPLRMAVSRVAQHELAWIVSWTSEEYLRTQDSGSRWPAMGRTWWTASTAVCTRSVSSPR
ncbi:YrhB domain-containing protein [Streptomyces agglomeratus]|uniref:YrhB domain-containing protein n=1 Tax=Streptomyces agglomeratus TaxID=285458 RepID=UPI0034E5FCA3